MINLKRLVEATEPDILLVTGDFWHNNPDGRGEEFMSFAIQHTEELGITWAFAWGNHDRLNNYARGHDAFEQAQHSLYVGGKSQGNYVVAVKDNQGNRLWDLVCLNSSIGADRGVYTPGLAGAAQHWLSELKKEWETEAHAANAFVFFHIPVPQYKSIWDSGVAQGVKYENVCSGDEDDRGAFSWFQELGTVRATFCGHDHVNDYSGKLAGIELVYGRATGYGGYGGDKVTKGGKLITVNCETGEYTWKSLTFDSLTGLREDGERQPEVFRLEQNYPNPFNSSTTLRYSLARAAVVDLAIFDLEGRRVKTLTYGLQKPGVYRVTWDGTDDSGSPVSSGTYFTQLRAAGETDTRTLVLLK
ncbi:MAG: T9SS type A sorting domain-containing protein [Calditrichaeota bacterium]|nr:T9SS type A sorting domain-containing protein [Calditrichota bacterium]